ncbi:acetylornithine deacetylase [Acuticoccus mangrovi]|uniref:Acetylornithine deacetylase n=1 Tax=Acuticoccus mangrovi TaxID=2796142 RepID=A0A934MF38_9HYPH|nr:acetylornithine deacetylase [Acuticoccus mangrovi]MBJ3774520.1 acetylornithine deacetylase [Acuticoccus mangrovi]
MSPLPFEASVEILADLVGFPTISAASNRALIDHAARLLNAAGARVEVLASADGAKANLFATLGPEVDGGIVLSGHTDVVPADGAEWDSDPFALREADGRFYGRGTCDMKGFVAAALAMAPRFAAMPLVRPVHFAFTYDEEVGCLGARALAGHLADAPLRPAMAIVGEPTSMRVIEGHKGCHDYTTRFTGLEGHGSNPDRGVNAVEYAIRFAARLLALREPLVQRAPSASPFEPPWSTVQVGRIDGGTARNVIARHCEVEWEMRPVTAADATFVKGELAAYCADVLLPEMRRLHPEATIETEILGEVPGLVPMEENAARDLLAHLTGANGADTVAFGTEAGLFQALGLDVVVCGPGSISEAHKPNEFLSADQLREALRLLAALEGVLTQPERR